MLAGVGGAAIGAIANVGMGLYNAHKSAKEARAADARQYAYSIQAAREMPKAQRMGLEAAGYNPMLALGNIGGSSALSSHQGTSNVSLDGSSAKALGEFAENLLKDKAEAEVDNIKADTALKKGQLDAAESQRLQNEANTALLHSQTERNDLAYGRDIVDSVTGIAGTAGSLYSAKAMADLAKSNTQLNSHKAERLSKGKPLVNSSAKPKPSLKPHAALGSSSKSAGKAVKDIGKRILSDPLSLPLILGGAAMYEYATPEGRKRQGDHYRRNWENNKSFSPLR